MRTIPIRLKKEPRKNWEQYFNKMKKSKEDILIIDDKIDLDMVGWEWYER